MKSSAKLYAVSVLLSLTAFGCAKSDSTRLEQIIQRRDESCLYDFRQGDLAPMDVKAPKMKTTYFAKNFDENKLNAILNVSGAETVRFAWLTGVKYYKTTYLQPASDACAYSEDLPSAPNQLMSFFNQLGDGVLGVYLPKGSKDFADLSKNPAIMVRIDADRWTLVHEYMHHLFSSIVNVGLTDDKLKKSYFAQMNEYEDVNNQAQSGVDLEKNYRQAALVLSQANASLVELLKRFYLEEMTIEANLGEKFDAGLLRLVPSSMRLNGAAYTLTSAQKIEELFSLHRKAIVKTREQLKLLGATTNVAEIKKLDDDVDVFDKLKSEMQPLIARARDYYYRHGFKLSAKSLSAMVSESNKDEAHAVGCSHTQAGDQFFESAKARFDNQ